MNSIVRYNAPQPLANISPVSSRLRRRTLLGQLRLTPAIVYLTTAFACVQSIVAAMVQEDDAAGNSMRKLRVRPSVMAEKIGTAVQWRTDLADAMQESEQSGKPIFWYVPTLPGTFMDRKVEIDRYMLAGPFSWPKIIDRLNQNYIPIRLTPNKTQQAAYQLVRYKFVEPGFLVLNASGEIQQKVDHITTLHPAWFLHLISPPAHASETNAEAPTLPDAVKFTAITQAAQGSPLALEWERFASAKRATLPGDTEGDESESESSPPAESSAAYLQQSEPHLLVEALLLKGMQEYSNGLHELAKETWMQAAKADPQHPLAWKAAAEREGFGPFVRGFEVHTQVPDAAMQAGIHSIGSAAPEGIYSEAELWTRGVNFLLSMQRLDGAIVDSDYDFGGTDSLPNVYVAVTSLVGMSLMDAHQRASANPVPDPAKLAVLQSAIDRAAEYVRNEQHINAADRDEILWAYAFRLQFLTRRFQQQQETIETINRCVKNLEQVQSKRGTWYHEYNNSFVTATALIALHQAQQVGGELDEAKLQAGLTALLNDRFANGAYPYASARAGAKKDEAEANIPAAAGRMPLCEMALRLWEKSDDTKLEFAVGSSLQHHDKLQVSYKYDNHTDTLAYGGFFFWYDMATRAQAIGLLPPGDFKDNAIKQHSALVMKLPELDGVFVDSHELGRCYGTAMALMTLHQMAEPSK